MHNILCDGYKSKYKCTKTDNLVTKWMLNIYTKFMHAEPEFCSFKKQVFRCLCFADRMWLDILTFEIVDDASKNEKAYGNQCRIFLFLCAIYHQYP